MHNPSPAMHRFAQQLSTAEKFVVGTALFCGGLIQTRPPRPRPLTPSGTKKRHRRGNPPMGCP